MTNIASSAHFKEELYSFLSANTSNEALFLTFTAVFYTLTVDKQTTYGNKFDYQSVPYGFAHCFNSQCVHKEECLHHLAATNCTSQCPTLSIINPNCIPADTTNCPHSGSPEVPGCMGHPAPAGQRTPQMCSPDEEPACRTLWQDHLLSLLPPGTRLVSKGTSIYPSGFKQYGIAEEPKFERYSEEYSYNDWSIRTAQLLQSLFWKHLSCYHAEGDILLIINRLKRERYPW